MCEGSLVTFKPRSCKSFVTLFPNSSSAFVNVTPTYERKVREDREREKDKRKEREKVNASFFPPSRTSNSTGSRAFPAHAGIFSRYECQVSSFSFSLKSRSTPVSALLVSGGGGGGRG